MCKYRFLRNIKKILNFLFKKFGDSEKGCIFALAFGNEASRQGQRLVKEAKLRKSSLKDLHRRRSTGAVS